MVGIQSESLTEQASKKLNYRFSFGEEALTVSLTRPTSYLSLLMILLEDDLPRPYTLGK